MTMLRFLPHQRVGFREYMRSDGTFSYFFSLDVVRELFHAAGLVEVTLSCLEYFQYLMVPFELPPLAESLMQEFQNYVS